MLTALPNLTELDLDVTGVTGEDDFSVLTALPKLSVLSLDGKKFTGDDLQALLSRQSQ